MFSFRPPTYHMTVICHAGLFSLSGGLIKSGDLRHVAMALKNSKVLKNSHFDQNGHAFYRIAAFFLLRRKEID